MVDVRLVEFVHWILVVSFHFVRMHSDLRYLEPGLSKEFRRGEYAFDFSGRHCNTAPGFLCVGEYFFVPWNLLLQRELLLRVLTVVRPAHAHTLQGSGRLV